MTTQVQAVMCGGQFASAAAITKSDAAANVFDAVWVGGAGNLAVILENDTSAVTLVAVPAGTLMPLRTSKVMSTNTTATNMVGLLV